MARKRIELAEVRTVRDEIESRSFAFNRRPGARNNRGRIPDGAGISFSFFDLGYWDISQVSGFDGAAYSTAINSAYSAAQLTPVNSPTIDEAGIGGRRSLVVSSTGNKYLTSNTLASRITIGNAWTVVTRYRATSSVADQPEWAVGSSTDAVNTWFRVYRTTLGALRVSSNTIASGTINRTTATGLLQYDEHVIIVSCTAAGVISVYIDGSPVALDNSAQDTAAIVCNRLAFGCVLSTAPAFVGDGPFQIVGMSSQAISAAGAASITAQLYAQDFVLRKSASTQVLWVGDSITESSVGTTLGAGIREYELIWTVENGISLNHVGNRVQGTIPDRENVAQGGADIATIQSNVTAAFSGDPTLAPRLIVIMMGTNNISGGVVATWMAAFRTAINAIYAAAVARNAGVRIAVSTLTPIQPGTIPADTNWPIFNTGLTTPTTGEFDVFDAANPGAPLIRLDNAAALGGAWSAGDFGANTTHPNETGVQKIGAAQMLVYGTFIRALSPTIKTLRVDIVSPSGGASFVNGSTVTVTVRVSRYPSTVVVKKGSTTLGSATMTKRDGTFAWVTGAGDIGAQTINATVTDTIDTSTADAAGVNITIT